MNTPCERDGQLDPSGTTATTCRMERLQDAQSPRTEANKSSTTTSKCSSGIEDDWAGPAPASCKHPTNVAMIGCTPLRSQGAGSGLQGLVPAAIPARPPAQQTFNLRHGKHWLFFLPPHRTIYTHFPSLLMKHFGCKYHRPVLKAQSRVDISVAFLLTTTHRLILADPIN